MWSYHGVFLHFSPIETYCVWFQAFAAWMRATAPGRVRMLLSTCEQIYILAFFLSKMKCVPLYLCLCHLPPLLSLLGTQPGRAGRLQMTCTSACASVDIKEDFSEKGHQSWAAGRGSKDTGTMGHLLKPTPLLQMRMSKRPARPHVHALTDGPQPGLQKSSKDSLSP